MHAVPEDSPAGEFDTYLFAVLYPPAQVRWQAPFGRPNWLAAQTQVTEREWSRRRKPTS